LTGLVCGCAAQAVKQRRTISDNALIALICKQKRIGRIFKTFDVFGSGLLQRLSMSESHAVNLVNVPEPSEEHSQKRTDHARERSKQ
jgi:hypothetical protein